MNNKKREEINNCLKGFGVKDEDVRFILSLVINEISEKDDNDQFDAMLKLMITSWYSVYVEQNKRTRDYMDSDMLFIRSEAMKSISDKEDGYIIND